MLPHAFPEVVHYSSQRDDEVLTVNLTVNEAGDGCIEVH